MTAEPLTEAAVQHFTLNPGEMVVVTIPGPVTWEGAQGLKEYWDRRFPDNPCVVLSQGAHVSGVLAVKS